MFYLPTGRSQPSKGWDALTRSAGTGCAVVGRVPPLAFLVRLAPRCGPDSGTERDQCMAASERCLGEGPTVPHGRLERDVTALDRPGAAARSREATPRSATLAS